MFRNSQRYLVASALLAQNTISKPVGAGLKNWAGNVEYAAASEIYPMADEDIQYAVQELIG